MVRSLLCFGGIFAAGLIAFAYGVAASGKVDLHAMLSSAVQVDEAYQRGFRSDAMARINRVRLPMSAGEVRGDEELQAFLLDFVEDHESPGEIELDDVFEHLQGRFPGAQYLAANLITANDREMLLSKLVGWGSATNSDFDTINTAVFPSGRRVGALGILARRLPLFTLEAANAEGGRFFNSCPHCGEIHALEVEKDARTLILSCPYCELPFEVMAVDSKGEIRRASDYLEGFELVEPSAARRQKSPEDRVVHFWQRVAEHCRYQSDQDFYGIQEVWKYSAETWHDAAGDCEDTAILLADILISVGFEARVAIGWNGNIGQHAWLVVKIGDQQYVIESTQQTEVTRESLLPVEEAAHFYQPEQLFDRDKIYYSTADPERFCRDYFSPDTWRSLPVERRDADRASQYSSR